MYPRSILFKVNFEFNLPEDKFANPEESFCSHTESCINNNHSKQSINEPYMSYYKKYDFVSPIHLELTVDRLEG